MKRYVSWRKPPDERIEAFREIRDRHEDESRDRAYSSRSSWCAAPPFDSLDGLARWASDLGYVGLQLPTTAGLFDLEKAATSQTYADELKGRLGEAGVEITELSTHIQGQPRRRTSRLTISCSMALRPRRCEAIPLPVPNGRPTS